MKRAFFVVTILTCAAGLFGQDEQTPKPKVSDDPLTAEQIAVYRAFLSSYDNGSRATLNLANRTSVLDQEDFKSGQGCLKSIALEKPDAEKPTIHRTDPLAGTNIRVVDPEKQTAEVRRNDPSSVLNDQSKSVEDAVKDAFRSGLLTLSEIAFSKDHNWAVLSFSFYCGGLCGHGSTIVLHKSEKGWEATNRSCGGWIS